MHVYGIIGELLLRRSGSSNRLIVACKIVRTYAMVEVLEDGVRAQISVITSGYEVLDFAEWFPDWSDADNMAGDFQGGRPIDIAVPVVAYEHMLRTGRRYPDMTIEHGDDFIPPFSAPVAAVRIGDRWVEPILST